MSPQKMRTKIIIFGQILIIIQPQNASLLQSYFSSNIRQRIIYNQLVLRECFVCRLSHIYTSF